MVDRNTSAGQTNGETSGALSPGEESSELAVQAALAGLAGHRDRPKPPQPGELKYRLTILLFPSILLVFVALYVTSLASGVEPEVALFWAGGASVVLAVLARLAVGILGDDTRLVLNDSQIIALARSGAIDEYLSAAEAARRAGQTSDSAEQPPSAAQAAGTGGKE